MIAVWEESLDVGGGDVSCGVGGVGVRMTVCEWGIWEDGGGVMEEVVGGAGEVNLARSGETALDMFAAVGEPERNLGVVGRDSSVEGMSESWEACDGGAWKSILPRSWWSKPSDTSDMRRRAAMQRCRVAGVE